MFQGLVKYMAPRLVQDLVQFGAGLLVAHGAITSNQTQDFEGSAIFLVMLVVNHFISASHRADAAEAGAAATGGAIDRPTALAIAKGQTP